KVLARGERLVELLKQGQYAPVPVEKQVVAIYAGTKGYIDEIPTPAIKKYEKELLEYVENQAPEIFENIKTQKDISEETENKLKEVIEKFNSIFKP
ncbi:MAG TPA: F0F1 ATP synthase subunit alpha, partial [Ignavibacteriales bacterium]|nr:F0F1 ATP synthase subunit alpha [Ignavibacteriales bacterium]